MTSTIYVVFNCKLICNLLLKIKGNVFTVFSDKYSQGIINS